MERNTRLLAALALAICAAAVAIGSAAGDAYPHNFQLIEHWNGTAWKVSPSHGPAQANELSAVTALSAQNVWAVGSDNAYTDPLAPHWYPIAAHYNGVSWKPFVLPSPEPSGLVDTFLTGVSGTSASNVWAVGSIGGAVIEHYNGTAWKIAWKNVPSSCAYGCIVTTLSGVAALSRLNAWAVGSITPLCHTSCTKPLIVHWNGTAWQRATSPDPLGPSDELLAISARSARDIWAVGDYQVNKRPHALVLHWNGSRWAQVTCPSPTGTNSSLSGVVAIAANDVWAVGSSQASGSSRALVEHWNGRSWHIVTAPSPSTFVSLRAVTAVSSTNVWAVGNNGKVALAEHWNGHGWTVATTAQVGTSDGFSSVDALTAGSVWAVGHSYAP